MSSRMLLQVTCSCAFPHWQDNVLCPRLATKQELALMEGPSAKDDEDAQAGQAAFQVALCVAVRAGSAVAPRLHCTGLLSPVQEPIKHGASSQILTAQG